MPALPTPQQVREWTGVSDATTDDQLREVMAGEDANQVKECRVTDPADRDPDLVQAFYRRCARQLAARGVPLGTTGGTEEFGPERLSGFDAEIERLEGASRKFNFG